MKTEEGHGTRESGAFLAWTAFLWIWSLAIQTDRAKWGSPDLPTVTALIACSMAIVMPRLTWSALCLAFAQLMMAVDGWMKIPTTGLFTEHLYPGGFIAAGVIIAVVMASAKGGSRSAQMANAWEYLAPYLLYLTAASLFFAGFSKLNRHYFVPDFSTGAIYYQWLRQNPLLFFLPDGNLGDWVGILGGVGLELSASALLLFRATRIYGLIALWGLTMGLTLNLRSHYFEFVGLFYAAALSAVSLEAWGEIAQRINNALLKLLKNIKAASLVRWGGVLLLPLLAVTLSMLCLFSTFTLPQGEQIAHPTLKSFYLETCRTLFLLTTVPLSCFILFRRKSIHFCSPVHFRNQSRILFPLLALFVAINATVYFGLHRSNRMGMTMASNARLRPADNNHLVIRKILTFGDLREVKILESSNPQIKQGEHMPLILLRHLASMQPDRGFTYELEGSSIEVSNPKEFFRPLRRSLIAGFFNLAPYSPTTGPAISGKAPPGMTKREWKERVDKSSRTHAE